MKQPPLLLNNLNQHELFHRTWALPWIILISVVIYLSRKYNTCANRISFTYLFLALSMGTVLMAQPWIPKGWYFTHRAWFLPVFLVSIALIFVVHLTRPNSMIKVISYLLFVLAMAFIMSPMIQSSSWVHTVLPCLFTVTAFFVILSAVAKLKPEWIRLSWAPYLFFALIALLLMRLSFFIWQPTNIRKAYRLSAYAGLLIFSAYVLYDTKLMTLRANQCGREYDYVTNLIGLFLDFINMFNDAMMLSKTS